VSGHSRKRLNRSGAWSAAERGAERRQAKSAVQSPLTANILKTRTTNTTVLSGLSWNRLFKQVAVATWQNHYNTTANSFYRPYEHRHMSADRSGNGAERVENKMSGSGRPRSGEQVSQNRLERWAANQPLMLSSDALLCLFVHTARSDIEMDYQLPPILYAHAMERLTHSENGRERLQRLFKLYTSAGRPRHHWRIKEGQSRQLPPHLHSHANLYYRASLYCGAAILTWEFCPSVCPSVCVCDVGSVWKRLYIYIVKLFTYGWAVNLVF